MDTVCYAHCMTSRLALFVGALIFALMLGFVAWSSNAMANRQLPGGAPLNVRNRTITSTGASLATMDPALLEATLKDIATKADGLFSSADIATAMKTPSLTSPAEQRLITALQNFVNAHPGMNRAFILTPTKNLNTPRFLAANDSNSGKADEYKPGEGIDDPGFSQTTWAIPTSGHSTEGGMMYFYATAPLHGTTGVQGQLIVNVMMPASTASSSAAPVISMKSHQTIVDTANVLSDAEEKAINGLFTQQNSPVAIFIVHTFGEQSPIEFLHSARDAWTTGSLPKIMLAFSIDTQQSGLWIRDDVKTTLSANDVSALWSGNPRTLFTQKHYAQGLTEFLNAIKKKL